MGHHPSLSGSLPDPKNLSNREVKKFIEFTEPLDKLEVKPLLDHLESLLIESSASEAEYSASTSDKVGIVSKRFQCL